MEPIMRSLDLSSSRCYPLGMPNKSNTDERMRLDVRTGSSCIIYNSRVIVYGGCTLPLSLNPKFTMEDIENQFERVVPSKQTDYNKHLSSECFSLSLIERKWDHIKIDDDQNVPEARMFHAMAVYDNYVYISGGLKFNNENKLEILNDVWRFDTIDKQWVCYYPNGNSTVNKRFDHILLVIPRLDVIGKESHHGLLFVGGDGEINCEAMEIFDIVEDAFHLIKEKNFIEFKMNGGVEERKKVIIRGSANSLISVSCPGNAEFKLLCFDKGEHAEGLEPLVEFSNDFAGYRLTNDSHNDLSNISEIKFPCMGKFGDNIIVTGFSKSENKMVAYVFNTPTSVWTKFKISCLHRVYTHKLSKGFVWTSHHKVIFLGTDKINTMPGSILYFDNIVIVSLPFINTFGIETEIIHLQQKKSTPRGSIALSRSSPGTPTSKLRHNSVASNSLSLSSVALPLPPHTTIKPQGNTFAEYAHHVAQQMKVNSIRSVLPSYAIAIGKNAFERTDAFSDFEFVCSDGSTISAPISLCRRRWGSGFDKLFTSAYAKAYVEEYNPDAFSFFNGSSNSTSASSLQSMQHKTKDALSISSRNSDGAPLFRYPFQDTDSPNGSRLDSIPLNSSRSGSNPLSISRRSSLNVTSLGPTSISQRKRDSFTLPQSRRSSYNVVSPSRHGSVSYISGSRHSSLSNAALSRRNSLNLIQQYQQQQQQQQQQPQPQAQQPFTNHGSTLSRTSLLSTSANSTNSGLSNYMQGRNNNNGSHLNLPIESPPMPPVTQYSNLNPQSHPPATTGQLNSIVYVNNLPPQEAMPNVLPDGSSISDAVIQMTSHEISAEDIPTSEERPNSITSATNLSGAKIHSSTPPTPSNPKIQLENIEFPVMPNVRFNASRMPRALYLPYSKNTVHAIVEFMYSGQIGASWRLFPTGVELLIVSKRLGLPLLYDLVLELFFVVVAIIEANVKLKMSNDVASVSDDGLDDDLLDWDLLSKAAENGRRDSESTINSDMMLNDNDLFDENEINRNESMNKSNISCVKDDNESKDPKEPDHVVESFKMNISRSMSPKNTRFVDLSENVVSEILVEDESLEFKKRAGFLDDNGYETSDYDDDGDSFTDIDNSFVVDSLKKFTLDDNNDKEQNNEQKLITRAKPKSKIRSNSKRKKKPWPTFKEMLSGDYHTICSATIVELFIDASASINDTKLMLRAMNIKEMLDILKQNKRKSYEYKGSLSKEKMNNNASQMKMRKSVSSSASSMAYVQQLKNNNSDSILGRGSSSEQVDSIMGNMSSSDLSSLHSVRSKLSGINDLDTLNKSATNITNVSSATITTKSNKLKSDKFTDGISRTTTNNSILNPNTSKGSKNDAKDGDKDKKKDRKGLFSRFSRH